MLLHGKTHKSQCVFGVTNLWCHHLSGPKQNLSVGWDKLDSRLTLPTAYLWSWVLMQRRGVWRLVSTLTCCLTIYFDLFSFNLSILIFFKHLWCQQHLDPDVLLSSIYLCSKKTFSELVLLQRLSGTGPHFNNFEDQMWCNFLLHHVGTAWKTTKSL